MHNDPDTMPLLGAALGDALGSGVEGGKALARAIREDADGIGRRFWPYSPFGFAPGEVTDDTQMALTAILALRRGRPEVTAEHGRRAYVKRLGDAYRTWYASAPPDVGSATGAALRLDSVGGGWRSWAGGDSAGNGSLMRATAAFTAGYRGEALMIAAALDGVVTHPDPRCVAACVWYSATLEAARAADDATKLPEAMRSGLSTLRQADVGTWLEGSAASEAKAWKAWEARWPAARGEVVRAIEEALAGVHVDCLAQPWSEWPTGFVMDSLRQAAWAALQGSTADEPIRLAVLHGGRDADTIGAIAGGLVGARFGTRALDQWPAGLLEQLELGHPVPGAVGLRVIEIVNQR